MSNATKQAAWLKKRPQRMARSGISSPRNLSLIRMHLLPRTFLLHGGSTEREAEACRHIYSTEDRSNRTNNTPTIIQLKANDAAKSHLYCISPLVHDVYFGDDTNRPWFTPCHRFAPGRQMFQHAFLHCPGQVSRPHALRINLSCKLQSIRDRHVLEQHRHARAARA